MASVATRVFGFIPECPSETAFGFAGTLNILSLPRHRVSRFHHLRAFPGSSSGG
jgi:hypothetical protein